MPANFHNIETKFHKNFGGLDIVRMFAGVVRCLVLLSISPDRPRGVWNPEKQEAPCYPGFVVSDTSFDGGNPHGEYKLRAASLRFGLWWFWRVGTRG